MLSVSFLSDYVVCATSLPSEKLPQLEALGIKCFTVDVTSGESVKSLKNEVQKELGENLDVLINSA
jgi:hypothetical protein